MANNLLKERLYRVNITQTSVPLFLLADNVAEVFLDHKKKFALTHFFP